MSRSRSNYKVNIQDSSYTSHECVNFHDFVCQPCIFEGFQLTMENSRFSMKGNFVERCPILFVLVDVRFNIRRWGETGLHVGSAFLLHLWTALSTCSLPGMPTWPGSQQREISKSDAASDFRYIS